MIMSRPSDEFPIFQKAYKRLVYSKLVQDSCTDPVVKAYAFTGVPKDHHIDSFYCGTESSSGIKSLMFCFSPETARFITGFEGAYNKTAPV